MGLFNEEALTRSGLSAVEFFSKENNQKDVLKELEVFHDPELTAAFMKIFQEGNQKSIDDNSTELMTLNEYRILVIRGGSAPVKDQLDIIKSRDYNFIRELISHQKLDASAEQYLFRMRDPKLLMFYLERHKISLVSQIRVIRRKSLSLLKALLSKQHVEYLAQNELIAQNSKEALKLLLQSQPVSIDLQLKILSFKDPELSRLLIEKNVLHGGAQLELLTSNNEELTKHYIDNIMKLTKHPAFIPQMELTFIRLSSEDMLERFIKYNLLRHESISVLIKKRDLRLTKFYLVTHRGFKAYDFWDKTLDRHDVELIEQNNAKLIFFYIENFSLSAKGLALLRKMGYKTKP